MIEAFDIHKTYGDVEVLKGVNIQVRQGEIISIVGASGAGKTTFLQILGSLERADRGEVIFEGNNLGKMNDKQLAQFRNRNIGFVFQFHHLLPEFTALENVCIPAFIAKSSIKKAEARATQLLEFLGLSNRMSNKPSELSGGEQQRVAVARALMNQPSVVLADEPSGNLDSASAHDLHELFFKLRNEFNQTFVIVTHNEQLADMADRKLTMKDGLIV